ncbi:hypothetical protein RFI_18217, partial [Reticulomyxa filosa]
GDEGNEISEKGSQSAESTDTESEADAKTEYQEEKEEKHMVLVDDTELIFSQTYDWPEFAKNQNSRGLLTPRNGKEHKSTQLSLSFLPVADANTSQDMGQGTPVDKEEEKEKQREEAEPREESLSGTMDVDLTFVAKDGQNNPSPREYTQDEKKKAHTQETVKAKREDVEQEKKKDTEKLKEDGQPQQQGNTLKAKMKKKHIWNPDDKEREIEKTRKLLSASDQLSSEDEEDDPEEDDAEEEDHDEEGDDDDLDRDNSSSIPDLVADTAAAAAAAAGINDPSSVPPLPLALQSKDSMNQSSHNIWVL